LQRDYVERFELSKRGALHLTYHLHGDSRQRGLALLRLRQAYAEAGWEADAVELPDFLPLMLEFAALDPAGAELLERNREAIELVAAALREERSAYAELFGVITEAMGGLSARQVKRIRRLAAEGPPSEEVGLEPFAPPEVMPR
jgi:nitrate reductase delta subunit